MKSFRREREREKNKMKSFRREEEDRLKGWMRAREKGGNTI